MDTTNITKQITAFRVLNTEAAITPENLGVILQALADLLSAAATNTDLNTLTAWKANFLKLSTLLQSISLGTVGTDKVCLSVIQGNPSSGVLQRQTDSIIIKAATSSRAGVMTAAQVQQLNKYYDHVCTIDKALSAVTDTIATSLVYTGSSRVLAANNAAGTQLFSVTLPMATPTIPGLTTTRSVTDLQKALNTRVKELGNFSDEATALAALRHHDFGQCRNRGGAPHVPEAHEHYALAEHRERLLPTNHIQPRQGVPACHLLYGQRPQDNKLCRGLGLFVP